MPPPVKDKMKPKAPTCKELNPPPPLKRARTCHQADPVQTPLLTPPVKPTARPTAGPACPSTDPPKSGGFNTDRKSANPVLAAASLPSSQKASVPYPSRQSVKKVTAVPPVGTKSPIGPERELVKPSLPPGATVKAKEEEDPDSFFASLITKTTSAAIASTIDQLHNAEEIELAKSTFRSLLHLTFADILRGCSETFAKTLNTLVRSQTFGGDLQPALQLFKHAFPSLSKTYDSIKQSKADVDNQLQRADDLGAELNVGRECYKKLKKDEEDAQAWKKAVKEQDFLLQLRLTELDVKLTDLSSQKEVLYQTMKAKCIAYEKLEGEVPSLSLTKSKLEAELVEAEKAWVNFRSRFDSL